MVKTERRLGICRNRQCCKLIRKALVKKGWDGEQRHIQELARFSVVRT